MPLSFTITETMKGSHHFVDPSLGEPTDRSAYFRIDWTGGIASALNPLRPDFLRFEAQGEIYVEGLTDGAVPCRGTLVLDYLHEHTIRYTLDFDANGKPHRFVGQKVDVELHKPLQLIKTHTTCYGQITSSEGKVVSKSVLHFRPDALSSFLTSVRFSITAVSR